jgi:putative transposase
VTGKSDVSVRVSSLHLLNERDGIGNVLDQSWARGARAERSICLSCRKKLKHMFLVIEHQRRKILHFGITEHPTAEWAAQQVVEAFAECDAKQYMIRDRDSIYGSEFRSRIQSLGIREVVTAPRSPWQNAFVERLIGSIRRECLDHVVVLGRRHLRCRLESYVDYYHRSRTHLALAKDAPLPRGVMPRGEIIALPQVGGLHYRYERRAA